MGEHLVGAVDGIPDGDGVVVDVDGRSIGVFNVRGRFFALLNRCAHQGGPLCTGAVVPALRARVDESGAVKEYFDTETTVVACPWHGWEYDLETGECLADRSRRVMTYRTVVRDGDVFVITHDRAGTGNGGTPAQPQTEGSTA